MSLQLCEVGSELPEDFCILLDAARAEGHRMLDRLMNEWSIGEVRFDKPGEKLLFARIDGKIVGVGGLTVEPLDASALRMRRFYVVPLARRQGVAKAIVEALLEGVPEAQSVGVHAGVASAIPFWEAIGFDKVDAAGISHRRPERKEVTIRE